mmetsp:Transcript_13781/g.19867  ORF Transcript_13781/g.19867 Transcript_13781/m.19867 type:complete len:180 (-) Transcript_13781:335-874(-)
MSKHDLEKRMKPLLFYPLSCLKRDSDKYRQLAWIIGEGLDNELHRFWLGLLLLLLNKNCAIGKRFHHIYNAEGDNTFEKTDHDSFAIHQKIGRTMEISASRFLGAKKKTSKYGGFSKAFVAASFIHRSLFIGTKKSLWPNPRMLAPTTNFIHVSKFVRHTFFSPPLRETYTNNLIVFTR